MLFLAAAATCLLPVGGVFLYEVRQNSIEDAAEAQRRSLSRAELVAARIAEFVVGADALLQLSARRERIQALDPARCEGILDDLAAVLPELAQAATLAPDATPICSSTPKPGGASPAIPALALAPAFAAQGLYVSEPVAGTEGPRVVLLSRPIPGADGRIGLVIASVDLERWAERLEAEVPTGGEVTVFSRRGVALLRLPRDATGSVPSLPRTEAEWAAVEAAPGDVAPAPGASRQVQAYITLPGLGWRVLASVPDQPVSAGARRSAVTLSAALLLIGAFVVLTYRSLSNAAISLGAAIDGAYGSANGRPGAPPEHSVPKEIQEAVTALRAVWRIRGAARRAADRELRLRAELGAVFERINEAFVALDREWRYVYVNAEAARLNQHSAESLVGRNMFEVFPALKGTRFHESYVRALETQQPQLMEAYFAPTERWYESRCYAGTQGISIFFRDISERRAAEADSVRAAHHARALARRLVEVQEIEQHRLSAELHDRIGQSLTALGINLNIIGKEIAPASTALTERLADSRDLLAATATTVRTLIADLRPTVLDDYGLLAGLRWMAETQRKRTGMQIDLVVDESTSRLPRPVETALFRIAQEALNNAVKHAQAHKVRIELIRRDGQLQLGIADDGVGFDARSREHSSAQQHWGLAMMQERAEAIGASLEIQAAPGQGARILVRLGARS